MSQDPNEQKEEVDPIKVEEGQAEELKNQLARAMADLQNYKRRTEEEKAGFVKFANASLLKELLPIIDNLDRSITHLPEDLKESEWTKGMLHIQHDLLKTLERLGIKKVKTVGEKLNPKLHEGLMTGPGEKDLVVEEFEAGYTLNDEVLKPAKVKVGDGSK